MRNEKHLWTTSTDDNYWTFADFVSDSSFKYRLHSGIKITHTNLASTDE